MFVSSYSSRDLSDRNTFYSSFPSFNVSVGDEIKLREKSQKNPMFKENFESSILNVLPYISKNEANFSGTLLRYPERNEVPI